MSTARSAQDAGWRASRYVLTAPLPLPGLFASVNLFSGRFAVCGKTDLEATSRLEALPEDDPAIRRLAMRGLIVRFDEREALREMARSARDAGETLLLTLCPTMACNFDCPYCFEDHRGGKMEAAVQDAVVSLTERFFACAHPKQLHVGWFGGEPLLAPDVIEALSGRLIALAEANGARYEAGIVTNGYLLTQDAADRLAACRVSCAEITLDGVGPAHDSTRRLAGGGSTFAQIVSRLRAPLPFSVAVRHNVHAGNRAEADALEAFVRELARESGNRISYRPAILTGNDASAARGAQLRLLEGENAAQIGLDREIRKFGPARAVLSCGAQTLTGIAVDSAGRLYKCHQDVSTPAHSFGSAADWDPADPLATASDPQMLTRYLDTAGALQDPECQDCVWLPRCAGGCPNKRLFDRRVCVPYKACPDAFVLACAERYWKQTAR